MFLNDSCCCSIKDFNLNECRCGMLCIYVSIIQNTQIFISCRESFIFNFDIFYKQCLNDSLCDYMSELVLNIEVSKVDLPIRVAYRVDTNPFVVCMLFVATTGC